MNSLPDLMLYLGLGVGAALENVIPVIPADVFVALGGFLSGVGNLQARWVFLATWIFNVASALLMYRLGHKHGRPFFESGVGRYVLKPHQLDGMGRFYDRWGTPGIFLARFLPGIRSVVPIFAGVTHQGWLAVATPITVASAIWYGGLVWLGALAGQNLDALSRQLGRVNGVLASMAVVVGGGVLVWWWRTRHRP